MFKTWPLLLIAALLFVQCRQNTKNETVKKSAIMEGTITQAIDSLTKKYGINEQERISKGVKLTASFWTNADGTDADFIAFCNQNFISDSG